VSPSLVALYVATVRASALSRVERAGSGPGGGAGRGAVDSRASSRTSRARSRPRPGRRARPPPALSSPRSVGHRERECAQSLPET